MKPMRQDNELRAAHVKHRGWMWWRARFERARAEARDLAFRRQVALEYDTSRLVDALLWLPR